MFSLLNMTFPFEAFKFRLRARRSRRIEVPNGIDCYARMVRTKDALRGAVPESDLSRLIRLRRVTWPAETEDGISER